MSVPLSPSALLLLKTFQRDPRAHTIDELRQAFEAAGEPGALVFSAVAECTLQRKVRKVAAWPSSTAPTYFELNPAGFKPRRSD